VIRAAAAVIGLVISADTAIASLPPPPDRDDIMPRASEQTTQVCVARDEHGIVIWVWPPDANGDCLIRDLPQ
jgi:hypothetical protein